MTVGPVGAWGTDGKGHPIHLPSYYAGQVDALRSAARDYTNSVGASKARPRARIFLEARADAIEHARQPEKLPGRWETESHSNMLFYVTATRRDGEVVAMSDGRRFRLTNSYIADGEFWHRVEYVGG